MLQCSKRYYNDLEDDKFKYYMEKCVGKLYNASNICYKRFNTLMATVCNNTDWGSIENLFNMLRAIKIKFI